MGVPEALVGEWDWENNLLNPGEDFPSSRRCSWICSLGHSWEARLDSRVRMGRGCPYCAGQRLWRGFNDLATVMPEVAALWSVRENGELTPRDVFPSATATFTCPQGHSFSSSGVRISSSRNGGVGCPKCSGREAIPGVNDLGTTHPAIAATYSEKNSIPVSELLPHSGKKVKWFCPRGHEYSTSPAKRVRGQGCPYCSTPPRKVLPGFNDLATAFPRLVNEWSPENSSTPEEYTPYSNARVAWRCSSCSKTWEALIFNRSLHGTGCPHCCNSAPTSKKERDLATAVRALTTAYTWEENNRSLLSGRELDLYCAELRLAIEFNGEYWHSEAIHGKPVRERHEWKEQRCRELGITLLVIWERDWEERPRECAEAILRTVRGEGGVPPWMGYSARRGGS